MKNSLLFTSFFFAMTLFSSDTFAWRRLPYCTPDCPNTVVPPAGHFFERVPGIPATLQLIVDLDLNDQAAGNIANQFATVERAADLWNTTGHSNFRFTTQQHTGTHLALGNDNINAVISFNPSPSDTLCAGLTGFSQIQNWQTNPANNQQMDLLEVDVVICDQHEWFAVGTGAGTPVNAQQDLLGSLSHELGHNLGLGHANTPNNPNTCAGITASSPVAVMDTCDGTTLRTLSADDINGIQAIYGVFVPDSDGDGLIDTMDNCPNTSNSQQTDTDSDGSGDACDTDDDNDGVLDTTDNCPLDRNVNQLDTDHDGRGDACDGDDDNDGLHDLEEQRLGTDPLKTDSDGDGLSDFDEVRKHKTNPTARDTDGDGLTDHDEIVTHKTNPVAWDSDGDGLSDGMELEKNLNPLKKDNPAQLIPLLQILLMTRPDYDHDGIVDFSDNCRETANPDQKDSDGDGLGDVCDFNLGFWFPVFPEIKKPVFRVLREWWQETQFNFFR